MKKTFLSYIHFRTVLSFLAKSDREFDESLITFRSEISKRQTERKINYSDFR